MKYLFCELGVETSSTGVGTGPAQPAAFVRSRARFVRPIDVDGQPYGCSSHLTSSGTLVR
jgi:hypothetical protein